MAKGESKEEMRKRFQEMGIPTPVAPVKNVQRAAANPEKATKMEQIKNGGLRDRYAKFIEKEGTSKAPGTIPVPKVGKKPGTSGPPPQQLSKPTSTSNPQAKMLDELMYGNVSNTTTSSVPTTESVGDFGPTNVDTKSMLRQRLAQKQNQTQNLQQEQTQQYQTQAPQMGSEELDNRILEISTEVAKNISKSMVKQVLMEYAKNGKGIILESKTVKKAEIVGKNKVKIGGRIYKLTAV